MPSAIAEVAGVLGKNDYKHPQKLGEHLAAEVLEKAHFTMRDFIKNGRLGPGNFSGRVFAAAFVVSRTLSEEDLERVHREGDYSNHLSQVFSRVRDGCQPYVGSRSPRMVAVTGQLILEMYRAVPPSNEDEAKHYAIDTEYQD